MPDASRAIREEISGAADAAEKLGEQLARRLLEQGAPDLLEAAAHA